MVCRYVPSSTVCVVLFLFFTKQKQFTTKQDHVCTIDCAWVCQYLCVCVRECVPVCLYLPLCVCSHRIWNLLWLVYVLFIRFSITATNLYTLFYILKTRNWKREWGWGMGDVERGRKKHNEIKKNGKLIILQ